MKKVKLLSLLLCAGAVTLAGCNSGGGSKKSGSQTATPTSQPSGSGSATTGGTSGTSGTSGASGSSSTSITPVKTDWTDDEKALMRSLLDGEVLPFFAGNWLWEEDANHYLTGGAVGADLQEIKAAFSNWLLVSETADTASYQTDSANGEANVLIEVAGNSIFVTGNYSVGWPIATKRLMRSLLNGYVIPYAAAYSSIQWSENSGSLVGTIASETFGYMAFYNIRANFGLELMDYDLSNPYIMIYQALSEEGQLDVESVDDTVTHTITLTFTPVATAWTQAQLDLMATYMPESFPFVKAANWDVSWNAGVSGLQIRAPLAQVNPNEVLSSALSNDYSLYRTSGTYAYIEKVMSETNVLIDAFITSNTAYVFVIVYPQNVPTSGDWSTGNAGQMTTLLGAPIEFPGESWYEGSVVNGTLEIRGVALDAVKAAAIASFYEGEGYDVAMDPAYPDTDYLMAKSNGAGKYINLSLFESPSHGTYYLTAGLGDKPCVDRETFELESSSIEVEIGETFTVTLTRGNFVEGEVVFSTSNDSAVEVVSQATDTITYRVLQADPAFEVTAKIGDGSTFSATLGFALVPVTWSAEEKALMRDNLNGQVLPYSEDIKDMEWALESSTVVGSISSAVAGLATVRTVYEDDGWTYVGEESGVYTYKVEDSTSINSILTTYLVNISEEADVVYVAASFTQSWSAMATYYMNGLLDLSLPFFVNGGMQYDSSSGSLIFSIPTGADSQTAVSNLFLAAGWTDWGWDDDTNSTGARWFYKYSNLGRIVARVSAEGWVRAYLYQAYADYTSAQQTTMSDNLDGVILPKIPGIQITVQYVTSGGYVMAYGFSQADGCFNAFLSNFNSAGWTLLNAGSYYIALKDTTNGAIFAQVFSGDGGSGYTSLQCAAFYYADITDWSDDDKALMEEVLGSGNVLPAVAGAWDAWSKDSDDETLLTCEGYFIDVDAMISAYEALGYVYDDAQGTLTLTLDVDHALVVTIESYAGNALVDLSAQVVTLS